jgi:D-alanine-D-alanine ligase
MKDTELFSMIDEEPPSEGDKPPSNRPRPERSWRVAVIANVKGETILPFDAPADAGAEFDRRETIQAIQAAIESDGHTTCFLSADPTLPFTLRDLNPDICFNIAEGISGDGREAQVPALLELFRIPYTASRVVANGVGLDKTMTKRIWREMGLPTANYQEFVTGDEPISARLKYPLFVKPAREGTGMGMDSNAICYTEAQLRQRVRWVVQSYRQPALVEEFLPGREFTVAVMGRQDAARFSPHPDWYGPDGFHRFPVLEVDSSRSVTPGIYGHKAKTLHDGDDGVPGFLCPADVTPELFDQLQTLAIAAHNALGSWDVSRVDIRLDADGQPRLLEINTLPGLTPEFSDLCIIGRAEGISYQEIILEILYLGASRYGMLEPLVQQPEPIHLPAMAQVRVRYK